MVHGGKERKALFGVYAVFRRGRRPRIDAVPLQLIAGKRVSAVAGARRVVDRLFVQRLRTVHGARAL
jgi:hypothetical protein